MNWKWSWESFLFSSLPSFIPSFLPPLLPSSINLYIAVFNDLYLTEYLLYLKPCAGCRGNKTEFLRWGLIERSSRLWLWFTENNIYSRVSLGGLWELERFLFRWINLVGRFTIKNKNVLSCRASSVFKAKAHPPNLREQVTLHCLP